MRRSQKWQREGETTKGRHMGMSDGDEYSPPSPASVEAVALLLSDLELVIMFGFGVQGDMVTLVGYTNIAFSIFSQYFHLVLLVFSCFSLSIG